VVCVWGKIVLVKSKRQLDFRAIVELGQRFYVAHGIGIMLHFSKVLTFMKRICKRHGYLQLLRKTIFCHIGGSFEKFVDWRQCAAVMPLSA
jgi:hypothetical protein